MLREEQSNAFLRAWLSDNFPLGLYLLAPLTVAAISATMLVITGVRIALFVTDKDSPIRSKEMFRHLNSLKKKLRVFISTKGTYSAVFALTGFGLALSFYSYLIVGVVSLTALGISCIILGLTMVSLPRHIGGPGIRAVLQGATMSFEAQLENRIVRRATYVPPGDDGVIFAYVPLSPDTQTLSLNDIRHAPKSLVSNIQKGVLVYPVGSELTKIPDSECGLSIEERLKYVLVESSNLCSMVIAEEIGSRIIVGMKDADLDIQGQKYLESLGSLPSSLAACVIAVLHNRPVTLIEEKRDGDRTVAVFQLLGELNGGLVV